MRASLAYFERLKEIYLEHMEEILKKDQKFIAEVKTLREAIERTKSAYIERGSFGFCKACAERGIRCCGEGLEWKLSPEEFFINLYLLRSEGKDLTLYERSPDDCLFLGERGCRLILTPLFCRNFFCRELSEFLGHQGLVHLQTILQDEAEITFRLCEYLRKKIPQPAFP